MKQLTLAAVGFDRYAKTTRRAAFLAEMEEVVPWSALCAMIEPYYPKPGNGRPPVGVERMLRLYFLQQWRSEIEKSPANVAAARHQSAAQSLGAVLPLDPQSNPPAPLLPHLAEMRRL